MCCVGVIYFSLDQDKGNLYFYPCLFKTATRVTWPFILSSGLLCTFGTSNVLWSSNPSYIFPLLSFQSISCPHPLWEMLNKKFYCALVRSDQTEIRQQQKHAVICTEKLYTTLMMKIWFNILILCIFRLALILTHCSCQTVTEAPCFGRNLFVL